MNNNRNGFAEALEQLNTVLDVSEQVTLDVLEDVANYFANKLRANIPLGHENVHLREEVRVVVYKDYVSVEFSGKGWYWYLAEHGHKKRGGKGRVKGLHFVRNTMDVEKNKIEKMLLDKIMKKMGG